MVEWNSDCQRESIIGVTTCAYSDLRDSEDSEWEDAENRERREFVEHYNFDLLDGMTPMVYIPIPREGRRKWPKEDLIYRAQLREPDNEYCASVLHTEFASPRLETAVPPPVSVDVEVPSCREIGRDIFPREWARRDLDITCVINAELNDHDDLEYGDRPVACAASELMTRPDWLYGCAVLFVPVGDVRIGYIKSAVGRGESTDAAPVTESLVLYTFPRKVGLFGCRKDAAASRVLQGRDSRSIRFLVPDVRTFMT